MSMHCLQTEAGFVSLSDLPPSGFVEEIIVDKDLKGMVMVVTARSARSTEFSPGWAKVPKLLVWLLNQRRFLRE